MGVEIERKFLVADGCESYKNDAVSCDAIEQGYICRDPERTVRIRIRNGKGYIAVKGAGYAGGTARFEWETEIPLQDARDLLALCVPVVIKKTRYLVPFGGHTFEVDVFGGKHRGLVLAEVELRSPDEPFLRPGWLGREVTGDPQYYNAQLSICRP